MSIASLRSELNVPKNQYNSFGKYNYRNQEDILEAVKPLLAKYNLCLTITDDIISIAERVYVKATATLSDNDNIKFESTGFAREPLSQKGMNESQITGSASSYARKYALNALFLIDDTKDADTDEHHNQANKPEKEKSEIKKPFKPETSIQAIKAIDEYMTNNNYDELYISDVQKSYSNCKTLKDFDALYKIVQGDK